MVYVDDIQEYPLDFVAEPARRYGTRWCHMTADTTKELMDMARRLGLSPTFAQRGGTGRWLHFDLTPSKRTQAIRYGALAISPVEMVEKLRNEPTRS